MAIRQSRIVSFYSFYFSNAGLTDSKPLKPSKVITRDPGSRHKDFE